MKKFDLQLGKYAFDPLETKLKLAPELRIKKAAKKLAYHVIQFTNTLTQQERTRLQNEYKLVLKEYIPNFAFLEKMSPAALKAISKDPVFRASIVFEPAFKISPRIGKLKFRTPERRAMKGLRLRAILFSDAKPSSVITQLRKIGASEIKILDDRKLGGTARAQFVLTSKDGVPKIAGLETVRWIEEVAEIIEDNVNTAGTIQSGTPGNEPIWGQGIHGEGQVIGIIDSAPLDINHCFFRDTNNNTPRPAHRKVLQIRNASNSAAGGHATFVAGCAAGDDFNNPGAANRRGGAWASRLISGNNRDLGATTMLAELNAASSAGARIHSNSWHDNTAGAGNPATYNQTAADVDTFAWNNEDHLVLGSAGNNGEEQGPPGTAKNAICVGASQADPNEMNFGDGNPGPTADGRRKPDIMAPGCGIQSATVNTACGTGPRSACATSYATPHVAAAAALVRQYFTEGWYPTGTRLPYHAFVPSGALIKAMLLNSAVDMTGIPGFPGDDEGWGLLRLNNVLFFRGLYRDLRVWETRNANGLSTGASAIHRVNIATSNEPLKVTLVWTDPPGAAGANNPMINNLDLEVTSPGGTQTFLGNHFVNGVSATGGNADAVNNVEVVLINNPTPGEWTVRVNATQVNVGNPHQGYAMVATADIDPMISFVIGSYQFFELAGKNQPVRVYMNDHSGRYRGYIDFVKDYSGTQDFILHSNGIINAFMPLDKLHPTLDILRNEKPVYFAVNEAYNWAALKTGYEPTGEEETS
jgi:hypothetical protein